MKLLIHVRRGRSGPKVAFPTFSCLLVPLTANGVTERPLQLIGTVVSAVGIETFSSWGGGVHKIRTPKPSWIGKYYSGIHSTYSVDLTESGRTLGS